MAKHILEEALTGFNRPVGRAVGKVLKGYNDILANETVSEVVSGPLNKLWRAKILLDRAVRPVQQGSKSQPIRSHDPLKNDILFGSQTKEVYTHSSFNADKKSSSVVANKSVRESEYGFQDLKRKMWVLGDSEPMITSTFQDKSRQHNRELLSEQIRKDNAIQIINFSADPIQYIQLQTIPTEVQHSSENTWAAINSMGRNVPMYHYTGSETSISFSISWYSEDKLNPDDVLVKCRLLEAWTKADGYVKAPPVLQIRWGSADVFKDQFFILVKADYKLSNWRASSRSYDKNTKKFIQVGVQPGLQPSVATQELVFKRVSLTNLRHSEVVSPELLRLTNGIKYE